MLIKKTDVMPTNLTNKFFFKELLIKKKINKPLARLRKIRETT